MCQNEFYDAVKVVLDRAIRQTVEIAWNRLPADYRDPAQARTAYQNMRNELRNLRSPDYSNPSTAIAYLLEYHASHVNMAYTLMHELDHRLPGGFPTDSQVADFGAGTLAMLHGAWLYQCEMALSGRNPPQIEFVCIDDSQDMLRTGQYLIGQFNSIARSDQILENIPQPPECTIYDWLQFGETYAMNFMWSPEERAAERTTILTSLHTVYEASSDTIGRSMNTLAELFQPVATMMTFQTGNRQHALQIWPYTQPPAEQVYEFGDEFRILGYIQNAESKRYARDIDVVPRGEGVTRTHHLQLGVSHSITQFFHPDGG